MPDIRPRLPKGSKTLLVECVSLWVWVKIKQLPKVAEQILTHTYEVAKLVGQTLTRSPPVPKFGGKILTLPRWF